MLKKLKKLIILLILGSVVLFNARTTVSATSGIIIGGLGGAAAAGGFDAFVNAWTAAANSAGVDIKYGNHDFDDFGEWDLNGNFKITDVNGARQKVINDYTALAKQTSESYEKYGCDSFESYLNYINISESEKSDMLEWSVAQKKEWLDSYEKSRQNISMSGGDPSQKPDPNFDDAAKFAFDALMSFGTIHTIKSLFDGITGQDVAENEALQQQVYEALTDEQKQAFNEFFNSAAGPLVSNNIVVNNAISVTKSDLETGISLADGTYYLNSNCEDTFMLKNIDNGATIAYYDKNNKLKWTQSYHMQNDDYPKSYSYIGLKLEGQSYGFSYLVTDKVTGETKTQFRQCGSRTIDNDINYISTTLPLYIGDTIDFGTTDIPVVKNPPLTTDKPIGIITPDSVLDDIQDNSLPIDIPIDIPEAKDIDFDKEMPKLKVPNTIIKKFPFSLPFDLYRGIKLLVVPPKAPKFDVDIDIPVSKVISSNPLEFKFSVDLEQFETLATITRWGSTMAFIIGLIFVSSKIVQGVG